MENNYYRITAYHPEKDISIIMDSFGLFEKKWQFSADLIKTGFKIIEVSDNSQFTEGNIPLLVEPSDKYILRAYATGKSDIVGKKSYTEQQILHLQQLILYIFQKVS